MGATAVIAAAGSGQRLGAGGPKALVELAGRPLVAWCMAAFAAASRIDRAVVAAPPGHEDELVAALAASASGGLELAVVSGSDTRSASVAAALEAVDTELVAIHDAARPLLTAELVDAVVGLLEDRPDAAGAIAAAPITDTVKRSAEPHGGSGSGGAALIVATERRERLWAAQTPQAFRAAALREAMAAGPERIAAATDDAMLVEGSGGAVLIHPSPARNLKVTTADDLRIAGLLLTAGPGGPG